MKKLLFQLDTDAIPSSFDTVVAYDGGADHVIPHGGVNPDNVRALVEGAIFTRGSGHKQNTALFVGGSNMAEGEALFAGVQNFFFQDFRVSVMLDSNGSNTTAAAAVARVAGGISIKGKKAVILAGTGPVGQRSAAMLVSEGAKVTISSRKMQRARQVCDALKKNFNIDVQAAEAVDHDARAALIADAEIVLATGAAGVELLLPEHWQDNATLQALVDANATPPLGIGGVKVSDRGAQRHDKMVWGALGFGALKLATHKACIASLFHDINQVLDAETIFRLAKEMA